VPDDADEFVAATWNSLNQQIIDDKGEQISEIANNSEVGLFIEQNTEDYGSYYSAGKRPKKGLMEQTGQDYKKVGTIEFNPDIGFTNVFYDEETGEYKIYIDDPSTNSSPADVLDHEVGHSFHDLIDGTYYSDIDEKSSNQKATKIPNKEEEDNISERDNSTTETRNTQISLPYEASGVNDKSGDKELRGETEIKLTGLKNKVKIVRGENAPKSQ